MRRQFWARQSGLACASGLVLAVLWLAPSAAHAQYKNSQFGLGGGVMIFAPANNSNYGYEQNSIDPVTAGGLGGTSVSAPNDSCTGQRWPCGLPYRTLNPMVNFWFSQKLSDDSHWWFTGGLNLALLGSITDANHNLPGTSMLLIEPMGGPRLYFLTDNFKPFAELGVRVGFVAGAPGGIPTKLAVLPGIYAQLGLEFMIARDISFVISGRYTFLVIIDFHQENMIEGNAGVSFYF